MEALAKTPKRPIRINGTILPKRRLVKDGVPRASGTQPSGRWSIRTARDASLKSEAARAILASNDMRVRGENLIVRQVGPETVVYDRRRHRAHCLGPLAAAVWRSCDNRRSAAEIAQRVSAVRGEPVDETAVRVALRRLERAGLIDGRAPQSDEPASAPHGTPTGAGRREALCRVARLAGLAVVSVLAPTPEAAAGSRPTGAECTYSWQCESDCCHAQQSVCKTQARRQLQGAVSQSRRDGFQCQRPPMRLSVPSSTTRSGGVPRTRQPRVPGPRWMPTPVTRSTSLS